MLFCTQGETVSYADKLGLIAGGAVAAAVLFRKQIQYRQSHGIGNYSTISFCKKTMIAKTTM